MLKLSAYWLSALLIVSFFVSVPAVFAQSSDSARAEAIKKKLIKYGGGKKVTVVRDDGSKFKGNLNNTSADTFTIRDKTGNDLTFRYDEIKKVSKGGIPLGVTIAAVAAAAGVAVIFLSYVVARVCNESGC